MKPGLRVLEKDERDFSVGAIFKLPKLSELPSEFVLSGYTVKNQLDTDFCSAFATTSASELQEGVELSPEFSFAAGKSLSKDIESWGQDLRVACKAHTKIGTIEKTEAPFIVGMKDRDFLADINNWERLIPKAEKHKKQTFLRVTSEGNDAFDTIRQTIWKWRDEKRAVVIGILWNYNPKDTVLNEVKENGTGHAMLVIGWTKTNLIVLGSGGVENGDRGIHYISREVINRWEPVFGSFMFVDMPREEVQWLVDNKLKSEDNWLVQILKIIWSLVESPFLTQKEKSSIIKDTTKTLNEIAVKIDEPIVSKYDWSTKSATRHSCRVIMDEYNLKWAQKDLLCAVIQAESGFNVKAKNVNTNGSVDWGICQINDTYWIGQGKYFASPEEVLNYPEKSVRFMVEQYLQGNLKWWYGFTNQSYKRYLK